MQYTKLNDTTLKFTETITTEKELTKDEVLDRKANLENQKTTKLNEIAKIDEEIANEVEPLLAEFDKLQIITKQEWFELNPVEVDMGT
jgi:hypothetical protein